MYMKFLSERVLKYDNQKVQIDLCNSFPRINHLIVKSHADLTPTWAGQTPSCTQITFGFISFTKIATIFSKLVLIKSSQVDLNCWGNMLQTDCSALSISAYKNSLVK